MSPFKTLVLGILSLVLVSCSDSNENSPTVNPPAVNQPAVDEPTVDEPVAGEVPEFDGSLPAITNLYSQDQIDAIEALGLTINLGDNPPNIEGTYRMSPGQLQATSVPNDPVQPGAVGFDTNFTFFDQNNSSLTVDLDLVEDNGSTSQGSGSFISGSGQLFTVFFVTETTIGGFVADSTITISGVVNSSGIENLQFAAFALDHRDAPENIFIPENTGRLFIDPDGLSERITATAEVPSATSDRINVNALGK